MSDLVIERLPAEETTVEALYERRSEIQQDPEYQRESEIWDLSRRRLLIDSIIRGYDVPKLYFRSHVPRVRTDGSVYRFSVIDGKQRLEAIWSFLSDGFALGPDAHIPEGSPANEGRIATMRFSDLVRDLPKTARQILQYRLDVVTIETHDLDVIEDMFLRLNEATPLNAAEKRNAFGGPVPLYTRELAKHEYFDVCLPFPNARYRHFDMATKFMYFESRDGIADTKKAYLDRYARNAINREAHVKADFEGAAKVLSAMVKVFTRDDVLLKTVGMSSVFYLVTRSAMKDDWLGDLTRERLLAFESEREVQKKRAFDDESGASYDFIEFGRLAQSPNDAVALRFRRNVLLAWLGRPIEDVGEDD